MPFADFAFQKYMEGFSAIDDLQYRILYEIVKMKYIHTVCEIGMYSTHYTKTHTHQNTHSHTNTHTHKKRPPDLVVN